MKTLGFILTRHVTSRCIRANRYWKEAIRCIRRFYPDNMIMIIDDGSEKECITMDGMDAAMLLNCMFIRTEIPGAGEMLPYYYMNKYRLFETAVILHDSVFLQKPLEEAIVETRTAIFLWHFTRHQYDIASIETGMMIRALHNHESLVNFYYKKHLWMGCFGVQSVITQSFLNRLEEKYNFLALVHQVHNRTERSCMERVVACIMTYEEPMLFAEPSVYGDIYEYTRWGYSIEEYLRDGENGTLSLPAVKVWSSR